MKSAGAAVQVVGAVVGGQGVFLAVEFEFAFGNAVGVAADERAENRLTSERLERSTSLS